MKTELFWRCCFVCKYKLHYSKDALGAVAKSQFGIFQLLFATDRPTARWTIQQFYEAHTANRSRTCSIDPPRELKRKEDSRGNAHCLVLFNMFIMAREI